MDWKPLIALACAAGCLGAVPARAGPSFVNGLMLDGAAFDEAIGSTANERRLGYFSDLYYDPNRGEWWGLSDRGPGGGLIAYDTRVQQFRLNVNPVNGRITNFKVEQTVKFTDGAGNAFTGLNPLLLNGNPGTLGRSFDPEGLVINPLSGNLLVSDEYGPSLYEFDRSGRFLRSFDTPANLVPKVGGTVNYVADRDAGLNDGRQDNRGFEGLAVTPDGRKLYAAMQDPLVDDGGSNNGRNGRNVRIVGFDNDPASANYGKSFAQYVYQLELQTEVAQRITADGGFATATNPRQGRNIGLSAIVALNDQEFLVIERDNRGLGVDDPSGVGVVGSKRVYRISLDGATNVGDAVLPLGDLPAGIVPVQKLGEIAGDAPDADSPFIDLAADTVLPSGRRAEKWEGLAIGPRLKDGGYLILAGTDNDYSVTQSGAGEQFDIYVNYEGAAYQCPIGLTSGCFELTGFTPANPLGAPSGSAVDLPKKFALIPGVLHAYRASEADLVGYTQPVPEPQTYALLASGLGLIGWTLFRRRRR
jgi:hypothetical protein